MSFPFSVSFLLFGSCLRPSVPPDPESCLPCKLGDLCQRTTPASVKIQKLLAFYVFETLISKFTLDTRLQYQRNI